MKITVRKDDQDKLSSWQCFNNSLKYPYLLSMKGVTEGFDRGEGCFRAMVLNPGCMLESLGEL